LGGVFANLQGWEKGKRGLKKGGTGDRKETRKWQGPDRKEDGKWKDVMRKIRYKTKGLLLKRWEKDDQTEEGGAQRGIEEQKAQGKAGARGKVTPKTAMASRKAEWSEGRNETTKTKKTGQGRVGKGGLCTVKGKGKRHNLGKNELTRTMLLKQ